MEQRLIDASKVNPTDAFGGLSDFAQDCRNAVAELLNAQPTVDAVQVTPVVHETWEGFTTSAFIGMDENAEPKWATRKFFVHKKCGRRSAIKERYCPSCGAKMDGERRDSRV